MQKYLGIKMIEAEPMNLGDYNKFKGWTIPENEDPNREGYKVKYSDDYISWSPKEVFEEAYMALGDSEGSKIVESDVNGFVVKSDISTYGDKTTVVHTTLKNGFIISESSSCVDPKNYDIKMGEEICLEKIKNKVWEYLGFVLQCAKNGIK